LFFRALPGEDLVQQVENSLKAFMLHEHSIYPDACRQRAAEFSPRRFVKEWSAVAAGVGVPGTTAEESQELPEALNA
jgi:hypothetical protein